MSCGVYLIKNTINSKIYIGASINVENRFKNHMNSLKKGNHVNFKLQKFYKENKLIESNFSLEILIMCKREELLLNEYSYIQKFKSRLFNKILIYKKFINKNYKPKLKKHKGKDFKVIGIDEKMHAEIKIQAIKEKKSMNSFIIETLRKSINDICRCKNK